MSEILKKRSQKKKIFWNIFGLFFLSFALIFLSFEFVYSKQKDIKIWGTEKGIIIKTENNNLLTFGEISNSKIKNFQGIFMSYLNKPVDIQKIEDLKINQKIKSSQVSVIKLSENLYLGKIKDLKFFFMTKDFKEFPYKLPVKTNADFWILENYNSNVLNLPKPDQSIFVLLNKKPTKTFKSIKTPIINTQKNWILDFKEEVKLLIEK